MFRSKKSLLSKEMVEAKGPLAWKTDLIHFEDQLFFSRVTRNNGMYSFDFLMLNSEEECQNYTVEASMMDFKNGKCVFKATFTPRPIVKVNQAGYCLRVPQEEMSKVLKAGEQGFSFFSRIKITKNIMFADLEEAADAIDVANL